MTDKELNWRFNSRLFGALAWLGKPRMSYLEVLGGVFGFGLLISNRPVLGAALVLAVFALQLVCMAAADTKWVKPRENIKPDGE